jgi:hypothetical protein
MRRLLFFALPFLLGTALLAGDWQRVSSEACSASFALPGSAKMDTTTQSFGREGSVTRYKYVAIRGNSLYDVTCGVYPAARLRTDKQRRSVLSTMTKRLKKKGKVARAGKKEVAGQPGREVVVSVKDGLAMQHHRLVVAGNRLVIMTAGRLKGSGDNDALQRFFDSLEFR